MFLTEQIQKDEREGQDLKRKKTVTLAKKGAKIESGLKGYS